EVGRAEERVVWIVGDDGCQMSMQELEVIKQHQLPITVLIVNNEALGMVRQWQEKFYDERYSSSLMTENPDFVKLAEGFGIRGIRVSNEGEVPELMKEVFSYDGPVLVDARV